MNKFLTALLLSIALVFNSSAFAASLAVNGKKTATFVAPEPVVPTEHKVVQLRITRIQELPDEEIGPTSRKKQIKTRELHSVCSGGFISATGDIITAKHCTDGADEIIVETFDRQHYEAVVSTQSKVHDLALIHIDRSDTPYFKIAKTVSRGQEISILGSPLAIEDVQAWGKVAKLDGDHTLMDMSVLPGDSGGVVFNKDGELVGVAVAGFIVGFGMTHLNIAQGLDSIKFFLKSSK